MANIDEETRAAYQGADAARRYHENSMRAKGWSGFRYTFIARREMTIVERLLKQVPHNRVLDCPVGSGKLAPVLANLASDVVCADISEEMLALAKITYEEQGSVVSKYAVMDLIDASSFPANSFDVVVCLRLLQRVSLGARAKMLGEISRISEYAIVSFAINNAYHTVRRSVRRQLLGGVDAGLEAHQSRRDTEVLIGKSHDIVLRAPVARGLSAEWVYLVKS